MTTRPTTTAHPHRWGMVLAYELTDVQVQCVADGTGEWAPSGEPITAGPGCLVCQQDFAVVAGMPCPGRVWPDEEMAFDRGRSQLPRAERRRARIEDRRAARKHRCEQCHRQVAEPVTTLTGRQVCGTCAGSPEGFLAKAIEEREHA